MSSALLEEVVEETKALPPPERELFREIIGNDVGTLLVLLGLLAILTKLKNLKPEELSQARARVLEFLPAPSEDDLEDEFERELMAEGILGDVRPLLTDDPEFYAYKPVNVEGKPISETIIEERR